MRNVVSVVLMVLLLAVRYWWVTLLVIGALYGGFHVSESEEPRPGYVDTGETVTSQECLDRGGELVDDVCYGS